MSPEAGAIHADRVWKRFRTDATRRELRDHVQRARMRARQANRWRWALADVSLDLAPGESLGLIGANGSGKSTLLKLLTRVMYPYAGRIAVGGRVGALIEVKAGIHPELTGRENIYLYGTLLGLPRREVARRFDEIAAFAEIEEAVDRQVKFFSSGMSMRLGFAVAAFLEPDVLLVDEVLAVGDATFQQRCLDRMRVVLDQGTTLVFVSHDLAAVESTCSRGMWLQRGQVAAAGSTSEVMGAYRGWIEAVAQSEEVVSGVLRLVKAEIGTPDGDGMPRSQAPLDIRLELESDDDRHANLCIGVSEGTASPTFLLRRAVELAPGTTHVTCSIARLPLPRGRFYVWVGAFARSRDLLPWHPAAHIDVVGPDLDKPPKGIVRLAPVHVEATWEEWR